jgi:hypothetical protein
MAIVYSWYCTYGCSILSIANVNQVSIVERQYKISELLLNQGANPLDCDRYYEFDITNQHNEPV